MTEIWLLDEDGKEIPGSRKEMGIPRTNWDITETLHISAIEMDFRREVYTDRQNPYLQVMSGCNLYYDVDPEGWYIDENLIDEYTAWLGYRRSLIS